MTQSTWTIAKCCCTQKCDSYCSNWQRQIECSPITCGQHNLCGNRRWSATSPKLQVRDAGAKGWGVFAQERISRWALVSEYVGEIIDEDEKCRREEAEANAYLMDYGDSKYIDASRVGNISRFINHSCSPNRQTEECAVSCVYRIGIFALRDIMEGEEIDFDYGSELKFSMCQCSKCNSDRS
ncbi:Set domain-containing hypothetical protein [Phytophthora megakarya]|uniref:SET domain-containing protein n=1 Tax=Phytophthora megakarya TaxID=4795 RepID=A0A225VMI7_9STRA|nr:Set domain-containing hypothetical protein [Phytophthora megakarya]